MTGPTAHGLWRQYVNPDFVDLLEAFDFGLLPRPNRPRLTEEDHLRSRAHGCDAQSHRSIETLRRRVRAPGYQRP